MARPSLRPGLVLLGLALPTLLGAQARSATELLLRELAGTAEAPLARGPEGLLSLVYRDGSGRLLGYGAVEGKGGEGAGAATSSQGKAGGEGPQAPATVAALDQLLLYDLRRDAAGRIAALVERKAADPALRSWVYRRDSLGRLLSIELSEKAKVTERLGLSWDGEGREARLLLLDAEGKILESGHLSRGSAGLEGASTRLEVLDAEGKPSGGLELAWDAGGRLTSLGILPAPGKAEGGGAAATTGKPAAAGVPGQSGSAQAGAGGGTEGGKPGIAELLLPLWPRDEASFELLAELLAPGLHPDFRGFAAAGPLLLPYERPAEGRLEILWDGAGRPLRLRSYASSGELEGETDYRYDKGGLLVEAASSGDAPSFLYVYRKAASGSWLECSVFLREGGRGDSELGPFLWLGRRGAAYPGPLP